MTLNLPNLPAAFKISKLLIWLEDYDCETRTFKASPEIDNPFMMRFEAFDREGFFKFIIII